MTDPEANQDQDDSGIASSEAGMLRGELDQRLTGLTDEVRRLRELLEGLRLNQYVRAILNTRRLALLSFFTGVLSGLGGAIGATLVLALLVYILSRLEVVPYLGRFVTEIVKTVQQHQHP